MEDKRWRVYIVRCRGGSLYTGVTVDVEERVRRHNEGKAAKYTRSRRPVVLLATSKYLDKAAAHKLEAAVKKSKRDEKIRVLLPDL